MIRNPRAAPGALLAALLRSTPATLSGAPSHGGSPLFLKGPLLIPFPPCYEDAGSAVVSSGPDAQDTGLGGGLAPEPFQCGFQRWCHARWGVISLLLLPQPPLRPSSGRCPAPALSELTTFGETNRWQQFLYCPECMCTQRGRCTGWAVSGQNEHSSFLRARALSP